MTTERNVHQPLDHADHIRKLVSYFEDAKSDYRLWWMTSTALAMHFGFYDEETRNHAEALINMNRVLATRAELRSSDRVLDAGCGVGGSAIWLAREFGVRVVGINVVPGDIDQGRRYARRRNVADRVTLESFRIWPERPSRKAASTLSGPSRASATYRISENFWPRLDGYSSPAAYRLVLSAVARRPRGRRRSPTCRSHP